MPAEFNCGLLISVVQYIECGLFKYVKRDKTLFFRLLALSSKLSVLIIGSFPLEMYKIYISTSSIFEMSAVLKSS